MSIPPERNSGSWLDKIGFSRFRRLRVPQLSTPQYEELYLDGEDERNIAVKIIYKNGQEIAKRGLATPWLGKRFIEPQYTPGFAVGRCQVIGGGDYKTVLADHDGNSDQVIKLYHSLSYEGAGAQSKAEAAARKLKAIHEVASEVAPGYLLPSRFGTEYRAGRHQVIEIQQRAEPVPIEYFDAPTYEKLRAEADDLAMNKTALVEQELLKRGISRIHPLVREIGDQFGFTEIHWDLITQHLVSLDFVDYIDLMDDIW